MLLGGHVGQTEIEFGQKALRLPAKAVPEAVVRVVGRYANERAVGETFPTWLERVGGAAAVGAGLKELDIWPTPEEARLLRRLRRDRALRGRGRGGRVRRHLTGHLVLRRSVRLLLDPSDEEGPGGSMTTL